MQEFKRNIKDIYDLTPDNIHSVFYGVKTKNNISTDEKAIVYIVEKKLPLDQIPEDQVIPKTINIEGSKYITDVIQTPEFKPISCYNYNALPPPPQVSTNRTRHRPLSGGLMISNALFWSQTSPSNFSVNYGTIGFFAIDNFDNTMVGVTNNHVICEDSFISSNRSLSGNVYNIISSKVYNNPPDYVFTGEITPRILQFQFNYNIPNRVSISFDLDNDKIGIPKRYYPLDVDGDNYIDAALIKIDENMIDSTSNSQNGLDGSLDMPFASTDELDNLNFNDIVYSSGARTGVKGYNCGLVLVGLFANTNVRYNKQGTSTIVSLNDLLIVANSDGSKNTIDGGDSGSCVYANINGVNKIIGLFFAANDYYGIICRIDYIANLLNISAWDGSDNYNISSNQISSFVRPLSDSRPSIVYNGKTYWQVGLIQTRETDLII
jgi:hypothetical protein